MASRPKRWIEHTTVLAIHEAQISEHGGLSGLRSIDALESALDRPRQADAYETPPPDIGSLAARYAIAIVQAHPFVDGNKRVGFVLLELSLELNGYDFAAADEDALAMMWSLGAGEVSAEEFTTWVRASAKRRRTRAEP